MNENPDYLTKLARAVRDERELHDQLLQARRRHAESKRRKDALVNWLADDPQWGH